MAPLRDRLPVGRDAPRTLSEGAGGPFEPDPRPRLGNLVGLVVLVPDEARAGGPPWAGDLGDVLRRYRLDTLVLDDPGAPARWPAGAHAAARAPRLAAALERAARSPLRVGLFGAGVGARLALLAAARHPGWVSAVVAFGGRFGPWCAWPASLQVPLLRIVGDTDDRVLRDERQGLRSLCGWVRLEVVPGADPRLADPAASMAVAHLAGSWLADHLGPVAAA